ncbi:MAG: type II toxin-antitoxin system VapC family toxin [Xanthomonadales bacterium]|nr:type II toxin-antitoxin system VapC family toxin [Xanthomonadales bacterium]
MLLDTCIIIDYLRGKPNAVDFLESLNTVPAIASATVAELYSGVRGIKEQELLRSLVEALDVYDLDISTAEKSGEIFQKYQPSHGLDLIDAIIAATATINSLELATLNIKHFPMFPDLRRPY